MQRIFKNIFFVAVLFTLLFAVTAVSAADVSNDTTSLDDSASNLNIDKTVTNDNSVTNTIAKDSKNIKTTYQNHQVNDADFDDLFDTDGKLSSSVNDGDTITLTSDVTRSDKSYIINKAVNLTSTNNYTINVARSVKNEGEPTVIDITEENFSDYFNNNNGIVSIKGAKITNDITFIMHYIPDTCIFFQYVAFMWDSYSQYDVTFVGKDDFTLKNVRLWFNCGKFTLSDMNIIYDEDYSQGEYENTFI